MYSVVGESRNEKDATKKKLFGRKYEKEGVRKTTKKRSNRWSKQ